MTLIRLYVAGDSPNSVRAIANLRTLCDRYLPDAHQIELIDVFKDTKRALADGVFLTPMVVVPLISPPLQIVGNLSDPTSFLNALGLKDST